MQRNTLNLAVDAVTLLAALAMATTGLVMRLVLPPGSRGGSGMTLWGMDRHQWGDLHWWLAIAIGVLVVVHLALHWSWVCAAVGRLLTGRTPDPSHAARRNVIGIAALAGVVGAFTLFIWIGQAATVRAADATQGGPRGAQAARDDDAHRHGQRGGEGELSESLRGSMTLAQAADVAGVALGDLRQALDLPASVSGDERLGRLRQEYGLEMSTIRERVAEIARRAMKEAAERP